MKYIHSVNLLILISLVFLGLSVTQVSAATLMGDPDAATGISDLDIGGVVYDVTFSTGSCVLLTRQITITAKRHNIFSHA